MKKHNKTKPEIVEDMKNVEKMQKEKALFKRLWPLIVNGLTIYEAQTALNAASGYIAQGVNEEISKLKVGMLHIDTAKEKDCVEKTALINILREVEGEDAEEAAELLRKFGNVFTMYGANEYLKNKLDTLKVEDFV